MITKDRYSQAFLFLAASSALSIYLLRNNKESLAILPLFIGLIPFAYIFTQSAKLHLSDEQKNKLKAEYKGEDDCGFVNEYRTEVDGLRIKGKRYKFVNGTDICVNEQNEVIPCGIGSSIMQVIGGGGKEPSSIQKEACWI